MSGLVGLYVRAHAEECEAARVGCEAAGLNVSSHGGSDFSNFRNDGPYDLTIVSSMRGIYGRIVEWCNRHLRPVFVIDYGYLNRVNLRAVDGESGHWQFCLGGLNQIPPFECPSDRFDGLGLRIPESRAPRSDRSYILVCGQAGGDPSQGGLTTDELPDYYAEVIEKLRSITGRRIVWRPHPTRPAFLPSGKLVSVSLDESFLEAVANAWAVVAISSNAGLEAILQGVPAFSLRPDLTPYTSLANSELERIEEPYFPDADAIRAYCQRAAYAQWTLDEFRSGAPIRFAMDWIWRARAAQPRLQCA